jgi:RNA recognition motif-containing protein
MSFTVFLGNLPMWVTADDIKQWLAAEDLVADSVKVIRNHETQESKGFAFVEAPTQDEMQAIIRRFDRAPLEDKLLRANPAQPSKGKTTPQTQVTPGRDQRSNGRTGGNGSGGSGGSSSSKPKRRERDHEPNSAFATELANSLAK